MALLYGRGGFECELFAHARMYFSTIFYFLLIFHSLFCGLQTAVAEEKKPSEIEFIP